MDDQTYLVGVLGLFDYSRVSAADYTNPTTGKADVTFDNYYAAAMAPSSIEAPATPHPVADMPQVIRRSPAPRANFYSYTNGISFTAATLTTNAINTNAIKLYLNGADVSSRLAVSGAASNVDVSFSGLAPRMVYDARIVLSDFSGRTSTNEFTFDTFDESYFDSPGVKVIEAGDYNYEGGKFEDNPPPSGLDAGGNRVPADGTGYYGRAGAAGIDYFDNSTTPGSGVAAEYRDMDLVGTQAGSEEIAGAGPLNDTIRQKYVAQSLPEYEVRRTEGGEWLNYTRIFSSNSFRVYLREACRAPQPVYLDQVTGDANQTNQATARLGVFNVPSTAMLINYRFVPLTDTNGSPAVVNLSGTNTLRLTFGGTQTNVTQYTMALNYLVFAPVTISQTALESSPEVAGTFIDEAAATIDTATRTITVALNGNTRFYRIRSGAPLALTITSITVSGANVVINYQ